MEDYSKDYEHFAVAVIVTNKDKNLFYLQQKDEGHPINEFRFCYCFFGGAVEKAEEEFDALKRELFEELEKEVAELIIKNIKKLFDDYFLDIFDKKTKFSIYESILSTNQLNKISKIPVKEGNKALIKKSEIKTIPFLRDSKGTLNKYIDLIN